MTEIDVEVLELDDGHLFLVMDTNQRRRIRVRLTRDEAAALADTIQAHLAG